MNKQKHYVLAPDHIQWTRDSLILAVPEDKAYSIDYKTIRSVRFWAIKKAHPERAAWMPQRWIRKGMDICLFFRKMATDGIFFSSAAAFPRERFLASLAEHVLRRVVPGAPTLINLKSKSKDKSRNKNSRNKNKKHPGHFRQGCTGRRFIVWAGLFNQLL